MYKRAVPDLEETQVMDELLAIMQRFEGWGLRANVLEMTAAIHTLQSFVVQHMLARIEPSLWSDWYITAGKGERSRANIRMEHILEPATPVSPTAPSARPRITADEPAQKPPRAKLESSPPVNFRDVTMSCYRSSNALRVGVHVSAAVVSRLGLKKGGFAEVRFPASGVMTIKSARDGVSVLSYGGDRLTIQIQAGPFGILEKHRSESVVHHFGLEDELNITLPAWWPKGKQAAQKPKDGTPASCKKMAGTNPAIKCAACQKAPATVECSRCPTLLCDGCWEMHVRVHWHAKAGDKAITAARDARHAMRKEA